MNEPHGVSIVVVNYNNGRYLAAAIDSALAQDHPLCEVIVVDDCSTDDSRAIIAGYGDRLRPILQEVNRGQIAALNDAWPLARHSILIFLDSDDLLLPRAAATFSGLWSERTAKAQAQFVSIDQSGRRLGHISPKYPPDLDTITIRNQILRTGGSPNVAGSGNAYSRRLLERIEADGGFRLDSPRDISMDAILECNAPFYGEVVTIYEPLACYRIHDSNDSMQTNISVARFDKMSRYFDYKLDYLERRCAFWGIAFDKGEIRSRSIWQLECRLAADRLAIVKHPASEPVWRTLGHALKASLDEPGPAPRRMLRAVWFLGVGLAPRRIARRLIEYRFAVTRRPRRLERLIASLLERRYSTRTGARNQVTS